MITQTILLAICVAAAAGLMRGFAGVGSGMLMAPFFAKFFGPVETIGIIIVMEVVVTAQLLPDVHSRIDWGIVAPMGIAAALFMPLGSWLLVSLDPAIVRDAIAVVVLVSSVILMLGWRYTGPKPLPATVSVGAISGTLMALTSLGNPPVMVYLLSGKDDAATNRANFTGYFAITLLALIAQMMFAGLISWETIRTVAVLLPVFMAAAWLGGRLFRKANETLYRRIALAILFCAGLYGLLG